MSEVPAIYCACGIPWEDDKGYCSKCTKEINLERYKTSSKKEESRLDQCDCGYPAVEQTNVCARCKKIIPWNRLEKLGIDTEEIRKYIFAVEEKFPSENQVRSKQMSDSSEETKYFCVSCGNKLTIQNNFCATCGTPNPLNSMSDIKFDQSKPEKRQEGLINSIPEAIRLNLSKYQSHRQVTCLECGYVGLMGIIGVIEKKASSWPLYLFAGFIGLFGITIVGPAGLIVLLIVGGLIGAFLGIQDNANRKVRVHCPNCLRELQI